MASYGLCPPLPVSYAYGGETVTPLKIFSGKSDTIWSLNLVRPKFVICSEDLEKFANYIGNIRFGKVKSILANFVRLPSPPKKMFKMFLSPTAMH